MSLNKDGTMKMVNLFRPQEGRWELSADGVVIFDPRYPERGSQLLAGKEAGSRTGYGSCCPLPEERQV